MTRAAPGRTRTPLLRAGALLAASIAAHAALLAGLSRSGGEAVTTEPPMEEARSFAPAVLAKASAVRRSLRARADRAALVQRALADRAAGKLALGEFLLAASRIDADERGLDLDSDAAAQAYRERLAALKEALAVLDVAHAVPEVFGDLKYYGQPGGLMASALVDRGGSCEQVSQLIAAAVHDAGRPAEIALRYYGGVMEDGAAHITPVVLSRGPEHDLMSGRPASPGGARLSAPELIDAYARAHDLLPKIAGSASKQGDPSHAGGGAGGAGAAVGGEAPQARATGRPTILGGLPPNADKFPGSLPLYAARALGDPADPSGAAGGGGDVSEEQQARFCPYYVRLGTLSPPAVYLEVPASPGQAAGYLAIEPRRVPPPFMLEREAALLRAAETVARRATTDPIDRLVGWACLAALGDVASVDFELAGEHAVAAESVRVQKLGRDEGKKALAAIDWSSPDGQEAARKLLRDYGGQSWILLALEGGERVVLDLAAQARRDLDGWIGLHSALVVWPPTRARAIAAVSERPLSEQVEVMQAIFQTSDRMRYLPGTLDLDGTAADAPASAAFLSGYRVFRRLAAQLWDGDPPADALATLERSARAERLDAAWEAALLEHYARSTLHLYAQRIELSAAVPIASVGASPHGGSSLTFRADTATKPGAPAAPPDDRRSWQRPGGMELVHLLRAAVEQSGHPSLARVRRALLHIEAEGILDPTTLADGLRMN